jgi:signal peptidase I
VFLLTILLFLLYMFAWRGMRFFLIPSESMEPTLLKRDYIVTLNYGRPAGDPARFDIIVFKDPEEPNIYDVKRVIALPGEQIEIHDGAVFINSEYLEERYVREPPVYTYEPDIIPEGHYFVLGDNRNLSSDSSLWRRSVPKSDIIGRAVFIYNPISRMGRIRRGAGGS